MEIVKTRLIASKHLYKNIKRINFEDNNEMYESFQEENRITLIESIEPILKKFKTDVKQITEL